MKWSENVLFFSVLLLLLMGLVMLSSTTPAVEIVKDSGGVEKEGAPFPLVTRQAIHIFLAILMGVAAFKTPLWVWKKYAILISIVALIMLTIVLMLPPVKGSHRWLPLGPINIQASEAGKIGIILLLGLYLSKHRRKMEDLIKGLVYPLTIIGMFCGLIILEPDYGTTILIGGVGYAMLFYAGTPISYLLVSGFSGLMAVAFLIMQDPNRVSRIIAFLNPEKYIQEGGWQLYNSLRAFTYGGAKGVGPGQGLIKRKYLPEDHTDFIFAIIAEEMGIVGTLTVLFLFFLFFLSGMDIARRSEDLFCKLLVVGCTLSISLQAAINIGVVTGCLPTKGIALPFISYGGSHVIISGVMVGLMFNVAFNGNKHDTLLKERSGAAEKEDWF